MTIKSHVIFLFVSVGVKWCPFYVEFYRIFVSEFGGNPNRQNVKGETSLHCLCCMDSNLSEHQQVSRLECLELLLAWKGAVSSNIERAETVDLGATDCVSTSFKLSFELLHENQCVHFSLVCGCNRKVGT